MIQDQSIHVAYAFQDGAHHFKAQDPRAGMIEVSHGVPEVAYEQVTQTLTQRLASALGREVHARPVLPFDDFFNWLRQNPIANVAGGPTRVEFTWKID